MLRRTNRKAGFTLLELMVTLAIIGLMAAIAAPSFSKSVPRAKLRRATYQIANDLKLARLKCISGNHGTRITFDTANNTYTRYLDTNRDGTFAAGEADIVNRTLSSGISFVGASTGPNVTFDPNGSANDGTAAVADIPITLVNSITPPESRSISVNRAVGRVKIN